MSVWTTSVTIFEIRYGLLTMPEGRRRTDRQVLFERLIEEKLERRILSFDHDAAEEAALLMAARRRTGRAGELRDTMIAGIALAQRATLATRNVRHFDDLRVPVVNPWSA
jgi:predicted nucleic acid-binding protein